MAEALVIETIGHRGDGVARTPSGPVYVPFTLPGETVLVEREGERGRLVGLIAPDAARTDPACRHFGRCGGCALQMMPLAASRALKRRFVVEALAQQGLDMPVEETLGTGPAGRRRAVLAARHAGGRLLLGYNERLSNRIVDIAECPILVPGFEARLPALRRLVGALLPKKGAARVTVLLTRTGLDIAVDGVPAPSPAAVTSLVAPGAAAGLARLGIGGEVVLAPAGPVLDVAGTPVVPPPGAFVQASAEAEAIMAGLAAGHLSGSRRIADLFAGIGTFTLALAHKARVHAVEGDRAALDALTAASRRGKGLKPVTTERRDLFRFPLAPQEFDGFDGAVFDPPRAGATAQAQAIARSHLGRIVAISCNPATFARDARILVEGGYRADRIVPVDQFVHSAATEIVGLFSRG